MNFDKFEYKKMYVPLGYERTAMGLGNTAEARSVNIEESNKVWVEANKLGQEGWELISTVPCTSSEYFHPMQVTFAYTGGYILIFKRRIQE